MLAEVGGHGVSHFEGVCGVCVCRLSVWLLKRVVERLVVYISKELWWLLFAGVELLSSLLILDVRNNVQGQASGNLFFLLL